MWKKSPKFQAKNHLSENLCWYFYHVTVFNQIVTCFELFSIGLTPVAFGCVNTVAWACSTCVAAVPYGWEPGGTWVAGVPWRHRPIGTWVTAIP